MQSLSRQLTAVQQVVAPSAHADIQSANKQQQQQQSRADGAAKLMAAKASLTKAQKQYLPPDTLAMMEKLNRQHAAKLTAAENRLKSRHAAEVQQVKASHRAKEAKLKVDLVAANTAQTLFEVQLQQVRFEHEQQLTEQSRAQGRMRGEFQAQGLAEKAVNGRLKVRVKAAESQCDQYREKIQQLQAQIAKLPTDAEAAKVNGKVADKKLQANAAVQTMRFQVRRMIIVTHCKVAWSHDSGKSRITLLDFSAQQHQAYKQIS